MGQTSLCKYFIGFSYDVCALYRQFEGEARRNKQLILIEWFYERTLTELKVTWEKWPKSSQSDMGKMAKVQSNEHGFSQIIKILSQYRAHKSKKITVSLVFGESNFISLLPALSNLSDIVLLADVNPRLHAHNNFLLDCFNASQTPDEFIGKYHLQNPGIVNRIPSGSYFDWSKFRDSLLFAQESVGKYHFYKSQESFDKCKKALSKMKLLPIYFNVSEIQSCKDLNTLLSKHNAEINFCNFTNIEEYDNKLKDNVKLLLKEHEHAFILCSSRNRINEGDGLPRTILNLGLNDYLATDTNKAYTEFNEYIPHMLHINDSLNHSVINQHFVLRKSQHKKDDRVYNKPYIAVFACNENQMQAIIDGKLDINSFPLSSAYDTEDGVNNLIIDFKKKNTTKIDGRKIDVNNYWLVSLYKDAKNINRFLKRATCLSSDIETKNLFRKNRINNHLKIYPRIISATNMDASITIIKRPIASRLNIRN